MYLKPKLRLKTNVCSGSKGLHEKTSLKDAEKLSFDKVASHKCGIVHDVNSSR